STAVSIGNVAQGGTSNPVPINTTCSDTLDAQEPDTATVSCFCTADLNPNFKATATDTASFDCQTPGLTVTKDCALRDTNGNSAVTITVTNTGSAALANCKVTDTNLTGETCTTPPGLPAAEISVAVSPNMFDLGVGAPAVTATGTITGLTQDSCNTVSVTCDIVGSVDPNNPGHPKTLSASAQDTCETCSVKVDKQVKCGAGPFVDVGFVTNNEDGTASCLGWNAFTVNGTSVAAEALTVQYVAQNTGGTALFGCTVTDSDTAISSTAVSIGDVAQGGTSSPVPVNKTCSDTLDASEPATAPAVTGTIAGLTQNSCNTTTVTCEIVGSVDPANPSARKKLTATAQDTCETCSVKVDKQIKCGAGPFVDVGFVTNNEDGTASCLGWNAFTLNGTSTAAETLTVQYVAQNTGGTALFGCTVTDSNTAISIGDVAQGGTSSPVPVNKTCSDTLDASEPDTATLSCFCTADRNPNFVATAKDSASFDCQTPGLVLTKECALRDTNGNSAVT